MLILRRRWGVLGVRHGLAQAGGHPHPGTLQLTKKDIVYRGQRRPGLRGGVRQRPLRH